MQDGFLDAGEVANWILPGEVDHADNEAKHLIHETDTDKVNKRGQKHQTVHKQSAWFQTDGKKKKSTFTIPWGKMTCYNRSVIKKLFLFIYFFYSVV